MAAHIRAFDWSQTPLGSSVSWPQSLQFVVRLILDAPQAMSVWWGESLACFYNDAYAPLLGKRHPGALSRSAAEVWPDMWPDTGAKIKSILEGSLPAWNEKKFLTLERNGSAEEACFNFSYSPLRDDAGKICGVFSTVWKETNGMDSEAQFRTLMQASSDVVYRMSADWTQMRRLIGRKFIADTETPSCTWLQEYIHQDDQAHVMAAINQAIESKSVFELEYRVLRMDGSIGWTFSRAIPILDAGGEIVEWLGTANDITLRKQAEEVLQKSEIRYRTLVDASSAITWTCPPDGLHVKGQPDWMAYTGQTADEMLGAGWAKAVHPDDVATAAVRWNDAVAQGVPFFNEHRIRRYDGQWRWMSVYGVPIRNSANQIVEWFGMNFDITERKQTEEDLLYIESRYRAIANQSLGGIAETDENGRFIHVNDRYCEITGYSREELLGGMRMQEITAAEDLPENLSKLELLLHQGTPFEIEKRYLCKDGKEVWVHNSISPILNKSGDIAGLIAVCVCITERKIAEHALRESEQRFRKVFEGAPLGIAITDMHGQFESCNQAYCDMLGYSMEELRQLKFTTLIHPNDLAANVAEVRRLLAGEIDHFDLENCYIRKNGKSLWVRKFGCLLSDDNGTPSHMMALTVDTSAQHAAETELRLLNATLEKRIHERTQALYASEELNRCTLQALPAHITVINRQGRILATNQSWEAFAEQNTLAGQPAIKVGANYLEVCRSAAAEGHEEAARALFGIEAVMMGRQAQFTLVYPCDSPEGQLWFLMSVVRLGEPAQGGAVISHLNVTEQKQAEMALEASRERFAGIVESAMDAIITHDANHRIMLFNAAAERIFRCPASEVIGTTLDRFIPERFRQSHRQHVELYAQTDISTRAMGRLAGQPLTGLRADGEEFLMEASISKIQTNNEQVFTVMLRDVTEIVKTETRLRINEERMNLAFKATQDGIWDWNLETDNIFYSSRWKSMLGYEENEIEPHLSAWKRLVHPDDMEPSMQVIRDVMQNKCDFTLEFRMRHKDGHYVDILSRGFPIRPEPDGSIVRIVGTHLDITERKRAEENLRNSEERLRLAQDSAHVGIWDWNLGTGVTEWTPQLERIFGYPPGTFPQTYNGFRDRVHPEDLVEMERQRDAAIAAHQPFNFDFRIRLPSGKVRWVNCMGAARYDSAGKAERVFGVNVDITARREAEEALRMSEERFRALTKTVPSLIWQTDALGENTFVSEAWVAVTGVSAKAAAGSGWHSTVHPDDLDEMALQWKAAVDASSLFETRYRLRMSDGTYRWYLDRALPQVDNMGHVCCWVGSSTDIDDLEQARAALIEADRRKTEFLAILAHELRNPLAPIRNAMHILKLKMPPDPTINLAQGLIDNQITHMVRLIDDLLDISRITRGKLQLCKERTELSHILNHAIESARPQLEQAAHTLGITLPPQPIYLNADPVRLTQVFLNLLNNAAKYTPRGGRIRLTAVQDGSEVDVTVSDNGIGIPPERLIDIFDMFAQINGGQGRAQEGLGIGLALTKGLVQMHGGRIEACSAGLGQGSQFIVRLPILYEPTVQAEARNAPAKVSKQSRSLRILVVDDILSNVKALTMVLEIYGHQVESAYDGLEAVEAAARFQPEVILLDIGMPNLDGYEACRRIREQFSEKRPLIVAMTGLGQKEDRLKSQQAGFDDHLVKPVNPDVLIQMLENWCNPTQ